MYKVWKQWKKERKNKEKFIASYRHLPSDRKPLCTCMCYNLAIREFGNDPKFVEPADADIIAKKGCPKQDEQHMRIENIHCFQKTQDRSETERKNNDQQVSVGETQSRISKRRIIKTAER